MGRSRGGFGTKLHLVTDGRGLPLGVDASPGQSHESRSFVDVMRAVRLRGAHGRIRPARLAGDKGYSYGWIRAWLRRHRVEPIIPQRANQVGRKGGCRVFDRRAYRRRNVIERCVGWLKECRRVATRFEKLALNYLAMVKLAMIERCFRALFSDAA